VTYTPHPYTGNALFCCRCEELAPLFNYDNWQPLCEPCARGAQLSDRRVHADQVARRMLARKAA
jgi:hypothetical protein